MEGLEAAIELAIERINKRIADNIDLGFLSELNQIMTDLEERKKQGEKLNLNDLRNVLRIYRNVIVPAAMRQQLEKLRTVKSMAENG